MGIHATEPLAPATFFPRHGGVIFRLHARFVSPALDARLAAGEDPWGERALALRSAQLQSGRVRRRIAAGLERACRKPDRAAGFSAAVPVDAEAVSVARPALLQLAAALRCRDSVRARGVALAGLLLTQGDGPLYRPSHPDALYESSREALLGLGPDGALTSTDLGA